MSIVDVQGRRTASEQDFQNHRSADVSRLLVDAEAIVERFSIELTIGTGWSRQYGPSSNGMVEIPTEGVQVEPGRSIVVEVDERIGVPYNMYGLVIPTGSLFLDRGIIIAAAKIEPAFKDKLKLRLVNTSDQRRTLKSGEKIASAVFFSTEITEFHDDRHKSTVKVHELPSAPRRISRWAKQNPSQLITWGLMLLSCLGSAVAALLLSHFFFTPAPVAPRAPPAALPTKVTAPATGNVAENGK